MTAEVLKAPLPDPAEYHAPASYARFVEDLKASARAEGEPVISPRLFASALRMDIQTLASRAHVHRSTITRGQGAEKLQSFLRDAIRVLGVAADINGNLPDALFWFRNEPIPPFDYQTPEQLVSAGRTDDLVRYVQSLKAGVTG